MTTTLSVQTTQLASNDRVTVAKLLKLGHKCRDTKYTLSSAALGESGLSTNALVALVRAALPRVVDEAGAELRPKTFVAQEVTVRHSGDADITLSLDLVD